MLPEGALAVDAGHERLWLLAERAAYWPRMQTLLVADAHLGKAAAFRSAGVPVPRGTTADNLERLTTLITRLEVQRVVFLGDLVHNAAGVRAAASAFIRWRTVHADIEMLLVRGNHDRHAGDLPADWNITCVEEPHPIGSIALCHFPQNVAEHYAIAGHVHPAARLVGRGRASLRLPCFWFTANHAVLPAFGSFTGMAEVEPSACDRVYVIAERSVVSVRGDEAAR